ncbi:co-chaperone GroES [Planctomycetota bacterium]
MATATKTKIVPLKDHVLVKRLEASDRTKGGIYLPETAKEKPKEGKIMAVGPGRFNDKGERVPMQVKKGNRVIFASYAGTDIKVDSEDYLILTEDDILAVIE